MSISTLIDRLEGVRSTGRGTWLARCPAHDDRRPSLSLRELDDGRVLVHCFGGCSAVDVVGAVGLELDALFPPRATTSAITPGTRRPFPAADILRAMTHEALIVLVVAVKIDQGEALEPGERARIALSLRRILAAVDIALPERDRRREFREAGLIAIRDLADSDVAA